jgi:NADH-quinone oxidoreductase subunit L
MPLHHWLAATLAHAEPEAVPAALPWILLTLAALIAVLMWRLGARWFSGDFSIPKRLEFASPRAAKLLAGRFYVDEIYDWVVVRPLRGVAELCLQFDVKVVDGLWRLTGAVAALLSTVIRVVQNGVVHAYTFWFLAGALFLLWLAVNR